jgi:hypothetical protein
LDGWETLTAGLIVGLLAHAAPAATIAMLCVLAALLVRRGQIEITGGAPLATFAGVAFAAVAWGAPGAVAAALVWRVSVELGARSDASLRVHAWTAPAAALAWRLDAPHLLVWGLACIALVAWIDAAVRILADWRLDADTERAGAFLGAQAAVLAPLMIFPTPAACIAAFCAMALARAAAWMARPAPAYAAL